MDSTGGARATASDPAGATGAAHSRAAGQAPADGAAAAARGRTPARRLLIGGGWTLGVLAAFTAYLRLASTRAVNSDGAGQALQAWDMAHGNLLLRGWKTSDVSFYTTELPQYMLVELVRGFNQDAVHVAAAMTYTLVVLFAALVGAGRGDAGARVGAGGGLDRGAGGRHSGHPGVRVPGGAQPSADRRPVVRDRAGRRRARRGGDRARRRGLLVDLACSLTWLAS